MGKHSFFLFCVSNGVKQGGILSPTLFNVYMDSLSTSLNSTNIGGGGILVANSYVMLMTFV